MHASPSSSAPATYLTRLRARPDTIAPVAATLRTLATACRTAEGCQRFEVWADADDPAAFTVWEGWVDDAAAARNREGPAFADAASRLRELVSGAPTRSRQEAVDRGPVVGGEAQVSPTGGGGA